MTTGAALAVTLAVLVAVSLWVHHGPKVAHPITGPAAAVLLLLVARSAGLSWTQLGLGRGSLVRGLAWGALAAGLVSVGYAAAVAIPRLHRFFRDTRYQVGPGSALYSAFVAIPLGTVVFEEIAFRSVLWGLLDDQHGPLTATAASAVLFGLWHVLPSLDLARTNTALSAEGSRRRVIGTVLGTVAFTTAAGALFAELRRLTGSVLTPMLAHWATNSFGVLAAARIWAVSRE